MDERATSGEDMGEAIGGSDDQEEDGGGKAAGMARERRTAEPVIDDPAETRPPIEMAMASYHCSGMIAGSMRKVSARQ